MMSMLWRPSESDTSPLFDIQGSPSSRFVFVHIHSDARNQTHFIVTDQDHVDAAPSPRIVFFTTISNVRVIMFCLLCALTPFNWNVNTGYRWDLGSF